LAGARSLSADRMPIIGPVPGRDAVFLVTGHGPKGIHLAPITARMIEDYVLHGGCRQAGIDPDTFLPSAYSRRSREVSTGWVIATLELERAGVSVGG
jgi:D-amino-acid dehydrogenase